MTTRATYRVGGAPPPTVCVRHPGAAVAFQCQECLDSLCVGCRGPGRRDRCRVCDEALERRRLGLPLPLAAQPGRSRWRVAIVLLLVANLLLGATWVGALYLGPAAPGLRRTLAEIELVAAIVERNRDIQGLVPPDLSAIADEFPAPVTERVRSGVIRYRAAGDRKTFELSVPLGQAR